MKQSFKIHFSSELLSTVQNEAIPETYTAEVIRKNQILVSRETATTPNDAESGNSREVELIAGEHTALSDDGNAIYSLIAGYPLLERRQKGGALSLQVKMTPLVQIQEDKMQASLTLYPAVSGKDSLGPDQFEEILREEGIIYGLDRAMLKESISQIGSLRGPLGNIPIARGILPIDGQNAYLRFELEAGPIPGTISRDGTIDFRERKIFTGVDENQVIAVRIPQTTGTPGINIFGISIAQQAGKDINVKVSGDVHYSPATGRIVATRAGVLSIVKGSEVKVCAKQTISGDVDFSVGNIESRDSVDIQGNVHPGFTVKTKGDLRIGGNVEGANILCKGNAVIKGGLLGTTSRLETAGDADINFIERAEIMAGGEIIIRKGAYSSKISGDGAILCSPESKMIGCVVCCAGNFTGGNVGTPRSPAATIAAGVDGKRYTKYKNLKLQILEVENKLEVLRTRQGEKSSGDAVYQQYEEELQELQATLRKLNLIPGTPVYSRNESAFDYSNARITLNGTAAGATKLRIGNLTRILEEEMAAVEFFIDENIDQIAVKNLKETC